MKEKQLAMIVVEALEMLRALKEMTPEEVALIAQLLAETLMKKGGAQ